MIYAPYPQKRAVFFVGQALLFVVIMVILFIYSKQLRHNKSCALFLKFLVYRREFIFHENFCETYHFGQLLKKLIN